MEEKLIIPLKMAKLAKEKGFNLLCVSWYLNENLNHSGKWKFENHNILSTRISAPFYEQLVRWIREVYKIDVLAVPREGKGKHKMYQGIVHPDENGLILPSRIKYEKAMEDALYRALEQIKL